MIEERNEKLHQGAQLRMRGKELNQGGLTRIMEERKNNSKDLDYGARQGAPRCATKEEIYQARRADMERNWTILLP